MKLAYIDLISCFKDLDMEWFVVGGTLIGLLRYGAHYGKIGDRYDLVDPDIDFAFRVDDQADYDNKMKRIWEYLKQKGWKACKGHHECLQMCFYTSRFETPLNFPIYGDFFAYYVEDGNMRSLCENKYPFQSWDDKMPVDLIFPVKKCKFYEYDVNCPNKYIEFLNKFNNDAYGGENSSLAYPDTYSECSLALSWWTRYTNTTGPEKPLTEREISDLKKYAQKLKDEGYESFYDLLNDPNEYEKYKKLTEINLITNSMSRVNITTPRRRSSKKKKKGKRKSSRKLPI
jgi:hypothetical protein